MPVHKDHQGKASSTFVLRAHQLLLFVATLHQFGTWVQGLGMRIDAQRAGAEASPSQGAEAPVCARFLCSPASLATFAQGAPILHAGSVG